MGYIKQGMTQVFKQRSINPYDFDTDNEVQSYTIVMDCTSVSASAFSYTLKEAVRVIDVVAYPIATVTSEVITLKDNDGNSISSALDISTASAVARTTVINTANWDEIKGNALTATQSSIAGSCWLFVKVIPKK